MSSASFLALNPASRLEKFKSFKNTFSLYFLGLKKLREYYDTKSYLYPTANISHEAFMIKMKEKV